MMRDEWSVGSKGCSSLTGARLASLEVERADQWGLIHGQRLGEINSLETEHHTARSGEEAVQSAINSTSIDVSMVPLDESFSRSLVRLVRPGRGPRVGSVAEAGRGLEVSRYLALR